MATTLLHVGKAITPSSEIRDAGILIRDGEIERVGKRDELELPAGRNGNPGRRLDSDPGLY